MKFFATTNSLIAILLTMLSSEAFSGVGVSISIGEPGFYGRLDIGHFPQPRLIYAEPMVARRVTTWYPPIYLRVPPAHHKHWYQHCAAYNACGRPVYFVDDVWYRDVYAPRYREHRRVAAPPPPPPRKPAYYEYRSHPNKPSQRIYPQEHRQDKPRRDEPRGRR